LIEQESAIAASLTVVTITKDNFDELVDTTKSVYRFIDKFSSFQIEHMIVDGSEKEVENFNGIERSNYVRQNDRSGIYGALNIAHQVCNTDYILFIHSGDRIFKGIEYNKIAPNLSGIMVCGKVRNILDKTIEKNIRSPADHFGLPHGGVFFPKSIYKKYFYDTKYLAAGDFEYWNRLERHGVYKFKAIPYIVSDFSIGGLSTAAESTFYTRSERKKILKKYDKPVGLLFDLKTVIRYLILKLSS